MEKCLFCKIIQNEIPVKKVYENEKVLGFEDIGPQAQTHLLFIHKSHTDHINELSQYDSPQLVDIFEAIRIYTQENKLEKEGFRIVTNVGKNAGQTVFHTHFHVLGGEKLGPFGR